MRVGIIRQADHLRQAEPIDMRRRFQLHLLEQRFILSHLVTQGLTQRNRALQRPAQAGIIDIHPGQKRALAGIIHRVLNIRSGKITAQHRQLLLLFCREGVPGCFQVDTENGFTLSQIREADVKDIVETPLT